ncbi:hypothetical protein CYY_000127 [Polysphondylium violaceum]|uniref:MACPF domain-containing protein n=1 Tax=Polysphondylium violaceum TaxID=133409 RepID=A0A8J4Q5C6_9MYCE|nr:hypothetical protein CYY_000127 [Polysphondylium violaceum]
MKSNNTLFLFLLLLLSISFVLNSYVFKSDRINYDTVGCKRVDFQVVLSDIVAVTNIVPDDATVPLLSDFTFTNLFSTSVSNQWFLVSFTVPYSTNAKALGLKVTNSINQVSTFTLSNSLIQCVQPRAFEFKSVSKAFYDYSSQFVKIKVLTDPAISSFATPLCTSSMAFDSSSCTIVKSNTEPYIYDVSIAPSMTFIADPSDFSVTISDIFDNAPIITTFSNPMDINKMAKAKVEFINSKPAVDSVFQSTEYRDGNVVATFNTKETDAYLTYHGSAKGRPYQFVPVLGNSKLKRVLGVFEMYATENNAPVSFDIKYIGQNAQTGKADILSLSSLNYGYTYPTLLDWQPTSAFDNAYSYLSMPVLSINLSSVPLNEPPVIKNYMGQDQVLPYPYGYKKVSNSQYSFTSDFIVPVTSSSILLNVGKNSVNKEHSSTISTPTTSSVNFNDKRVPYLKSFEVKKYNSNIVVLSLSIRDEATSGSASGLYKIKVKNPSATFFALDVLASGSLTDGVFDLVFDLSKIGALTSSTPDITLTDLAGNSNTYPLYYTLAPSDGKPTLTTATSLSVFDITFFKFNKYSVDTSFGKQKNSLYFRMSNVDTGIIPVLNIIEKNPAFSSQLVKSYSGYYHSALDMFIIDFEIPDKQFSGELKYSLYVQPTKFSYEAIQSRFGENAIIHVDSEFADNLPPMVSQFTFIASNQVVVEPTDEVEIGWLFTIVDQPNGFAHGYIVITSDIDAEPRSFNITPSNMISGNEFVGTYSISFKVKGGCRSQKFSISQAALYDRNGKVSVHPPVYPNISPLLELATDHSIQLTCNNVALEETAPTLRAFSFEASGSTLTFTVKVSDAGGSGLSFRHLPYVFINGIFSAVQVQTKLCDSCGSANGIYTFTASIDVPTEILYYGCMFSVYGITDNHMNVIGYSSKDLKTLRYSYNYKTTSIADPVIKSLAPITDMGGDLTIFGQRFSPSSRVYLQYGDGSFTEVVVKFVSSTMIIVNANPSTLPISVRVRVSSFYTATSQVTPIKTIKKNFVYVDPTQVCTTGCGARNKPYGNIKDALKNSDPYATNILLLPGIYTGLNNNEIVIDTYREITSVNGPASTIIDCQNYGFGFKVINSKRFTLNGVSIKNCVSDQGGALYLQNSPSSITNVHFLNNHASNGGAIYISGKDASLVNCLFDSNTVVHSGTSIYSELATVRIKGENTIFSSLFTESASATLRSISTANHVNQNPMDMVCKNSTFKVETKVLMDNIEFECLLGCDATYPLRPLCLDNTVDDIETQPACSCLTDPENCGCYFSGYVLETYQQGCNLNNLKDCSSLYQKPIQSVNLVNNMGGFKNIVNRIYTYLNIEQSRQVSFRFSGSNYGFIFKINGLKRYSMNQNTGFNETATIYLTDNHPHLLEIIIYSSISEGSQRQFMFTPILSSQDNIFHSNLVCGDKIVNEIEKQPPQIDELTNEVIADNPHYCPSDLVYPQLLSEPKCGDKICNEEPNSCFQDCYTEMTKNCPTRTVPDGHIAPGFFLQYDTLGDLISNQFMWRLPGSDHLSFGVNVVDAQEAHAPLFKFDYCANVAPIVIEDVYRGNVYQIPPEFNAKSLPECSYSTSTEKFSSSKDIQNSMTKASSQSYSAGAGGGAFMVSASANVAFSKEKSVAETTKLTVGSKNSIFKTDLYCKTSFVELDLERVSLHPTLLDSLSKVRDVEDMVEVVKRYGTHHYKDAYLGGKLTQLTITKESTSDSSSDKSWTESSQSSMSSSVNAPVFSVSASLDNSLDKSNSESVQESHADSATTSRLLTYGGAPAAFSPASDGVSSPTYSKWTSTIDLMPVPLNYSLYPIRDRINKEWYNEHVKDKSLYDLWVDAERIFYAINSYDLGDDAGYSMIFEVRHEEIADGTILENAPVLDITYYEKDGNNQEVTKKFSTSLPFVHFDNSGKKYRQLYSKNTIGGAEKHCAQTMAFANDISEGYGTNMTYCDYGSRTNLLYPIRIDFNAPNFFESTKKPIITLKFVATYKNITNGVIVTKDIIKTNPEPVIIDWVSNQAIILNQNGVADNLDVYYGSSSFENRWGWHLSRNVLKQAPPRGPVTCANLSPNTPCRDQVGFSFDGNPKPFSSSDPRPVPSENYEGRGLWTRNINEQAPLINWFRWRGYIYNRELYNQKLLVEHLSFIGLQTRVLWVKVYIPNPTTPWLNNIKAYHIKTDQNPDSQAKEFIEIDFRELTPKDRFSPWKFLDMVPLERSQPKQLFFYHNYNFQLNGVMVHDWGKPILNPVNFDYATVLFNANSTTIVPFVESTVEYDLL